MSVVPLAREEIEANDIGFVSESHLDIPDPQFVAFVGSTGDDVPTERTPGDTSDAECMAFVLFP